MNADDLESTIRLVREASEIASDDVVGSRLALTESTLEEIPEVDSGTLQSELLLDAVHHLNTAINGGSSEVRVPARNASQLLMVAINSDWPSPGDFDQRRGSGCH